VIWADYDPQWNEVFEYTLPSRADPRPRSEVFTPTHRNTHCNTLQLTAKLERSIWVYSSFTHQLSPSFRGLHCNTRCNTRCNTCCNTRCNTCCNTRCNTLQHTATHTATLERSVWAHFLVRAPTHAFVLRSSLQHTATYTATHCNTPEHSAVVHSLFKSRPVPFPRSAAHRNTLQHTVMHCNTLKQTATLVRSA